MRDIIFKICDCCGETIGKKSEAIFLILEPYIGPSSERKVHDICNNCFCGYLTRLQKGR